MNVSTFEDGKLVSPYLGINSILDESNKSREINNRSYGLLICMAVADVNYNERTHRNALEEFNGVLLAAEKDEDYNKLRDMMEEAASMGGYAHTLYGQVKMKINANQKAELLKVQKDTDSIRGVPVSYVDNLGRLISPYFDVTFRPTGYKNFTLDVACSSLLMTLSLADYKRDDETQIRLLGDFCKILKACENEEEHLRVKLFLDELVKLGGYSIEFNKQVRDLIGMDNSEKVDNIYRTVCEQVELYEGPKEEVKKDEVIPDVVTQEVVDEDEELDIPENIGSTSDSDDVEELPSLSIPVEKNKEADILVELNDLDEFKESLGKFNSRLETYKATKSGDLNVLLKNARRLQDQLLDCMGSMNKDEFNKFDEELEGKVKEIRTLMTN